MNWNVLSAIFKRNFVSYFSSPTGYVFICLFVMLSSLATFWPPDFFNNNLANLSQLNYYLPFILLIFIPAITMSLWAEERRLGTDELLLTIPASDLDVVLGKYLAAVAIFTVALIFSAFSIYLVFLYGLGDPDGLLYLSSYIGYWFVGISMLGVGMIASFLTNNLTIAFILAMLFNFPLAIAGVANALIKSPALAQTVERWSAAYQLDHFQRGAIRLSSISFFVMIAIVAVYLSVVLIGRRHWRGGSDGNSMLGHYAIRIVALVAIAFGVNVFFSDHAWIRADLTSERLNSLSPGTIDVITAIKNNDEISTIKIDAYISPRVPSDYAETKETLLSLLDEISSLAGGKIRVQKHILEAFSEEARIAEQTYGIEPRELQFGTVDAREDREIFLGIAFNCGLDKVIVPFIDRGVPIEYELVRSIATVAQQERLKLGVLKTDVPLMGGFAMGRPSGENELIKELKKQYKVVEIDPSQPIEKKVDVLLAMQPSSLDPGGMNHFVDAVKSGVPTAIFEDPFPVTYNVPGTTQPKRPPQQMSMFGGQQSPMPKGDISQLWRILGIDLVSRGDRVIWQRYNPYPKAGFFVRDEWAFIDHGNGALRPFNPDSGITKGLRQVLFLFAGAWKKGRSSEMEMTDLLATGQNSGTAAVADVQLFMGRPDYERQMEYRRTPTQSQYNLAVRIRGKLPASTLLLDELNDASADEQLDLDAKELEEAAEAAETAEEDSSADSSEDEPAAEPELPKIDVVLVADIDWLAPEIFRLRAMGESDEMIVNWNFQNVTLVLNIIDSLAGEERFLDIRRRERKHRVLTKIEKETKDARENASDERQEFIDQVEEGINEARQAFSERVQEIEDRTDLPAQQKRILIEMVRREEERKRDVRIARLEKDRAKKIKEINRDLALTVRGVQDFYKRCAFLIPPIPPILVAIFVFFHRRRGEAEGVNRARLR